MPYICGMTRILTITAKGQVTIAKAFLDALGARPGDKLAADVLPSGTLELRPVRAGAGIDDFIGCLADPGAPARSLDEIREATERAWAGEA